ncbi:hypothetical protein DFA_04804 [Cavenderia fasciculata]|uniref:tRNA pseudouridine(55) synthase n=1 Tax=Cavenderia fasciculata TaxID=261658 RepID=F4PNZ5_CACFS|nr:uncharacterized protein DFA_04804 [Cavenderia fasciculata]EGG22674.1 hypothetical protein DFA_04804 [Cavenderia fasciculata]|eukprot:XP_004360525.1 hypothetical protein DFA_04804 [Cavenderia fasciculata]
MDTTTTATTTTTNTPSQDIDTKMGDNVQQQVEQVEQVTPASAVTTTNSKKEQEDITATMTEVEKRNFMWKLESLYSRYRPSINPLILSDLQSIGLCERCCLRYCDIRDLSLYQEPTIVIHNLLYNIEKGHAFDIEQQQQQKQQKEQEEKLASTTTSAETDASTTTTTTVTDTTTTTTTPTPVVVLPKYQCQTEPCGTKICSTCLGMLQNLMDPTFQKDILDNIAKCPYEFHDYSLQLTLPISVTIREYSVWYYLKQRYNDKSYNSYTTGPAPLASVLLKDYLPKLFSKVDIKEAIKWILGPLIVKRFNFKFQPNTIEKRQKQRYNNNNNKYNKNKKSAAEDSQQQVQDILDEISMKDYCSSGEVPPNTPKTFYQYNISYAQASVYISGRYNKYSRSLSQTNMLPIEYKKQLEQNPTTTVTNDKMDEPLITINNDDRQRLTGSVDELFNKKIMEMFACDSTNLVGSGREDIDVRMLGQGRPFFIELINARKIKYTPKDFLDLQNAINNEHSEIRLTDLQFITKKQTTLLNEGGTTKKKIYRCVVWTDKELGEEDLKVLSTLKDIELKQNTPVRVMHRRTLMERKKMIDKLEYEYVCPHIFTLDVWAQAGTYIKEFVHGDLGRTTPNVGSILNCEADILQLDVLNVELDFPPKINETNQ